MGKVSITAIAMTLNEEHNLEYCLRSVRSWCDEVIVVDMMSDDRTPEIAARYADRVLSHERVEGFDAGRSKALDAATGDWVFSIDADEVVPPALARWIREFVDGDPPFELVRIPRVNVFLGQWIKSTPWWPGKPRLFRHDAITISGRLHHGLTPKAGVRVAKIPRDPDKSLWHFSYVSLDSLVAKTNRYTTIEARQALERGVKAPGRFRLMFRATRMFWGYYIRRRGYRDGMPGLVYAADRAYYRFLSQAKRWDEVEAGTRQVHYDEMRERLLSGYVEQDATSPTPPRS